MTGNPDVYRAHVPLRELLVHDFWGNELFPSRRGGFGWTHHSWRPLVVLSFRWDHARGGGGVRAYHQTNIALHCASALAALATLRLLLPAPADGATVLLAAVLFAAHPVHSEVVANITSRADAMASIFQFAALALYVWMTVAVAPAPAAAAAAAQPRRCWLASGLRSLQLAGGVTAYIALLMLALACKETTLMLPFLCIVHDVARAMVAAATAAAPATPPLSLQGYIRRLFYRQLPWLRMAAVAALGCVLYYVRIVVVARGYTLASWANPIHNSLYHTADRQVRFLSTAFVQAFALSKLVLPVFLSHEHNALEHVLSLADGRNALTVAAWVVLGALGVAAVRALAAASGGGGGGGGGNGSAAASRAFALIFGAAFALIAYFPSSHLVQYVAFLLAERTLYIPSLGAALVLAELVRAAAGGGGRKPPPRWSCSWWRAAGAGAAAVALLAAYVCTTVARVKDWADEEALMASNLRMYPRGNVMTVYGLGAVALYKGELDRAEALLVRACNESSMVEPHILLSQLYWKHRAATHANATDVAVAELEVVAATSTPRREVLTNLGLLRLARAAPGDEPPLRAAEHLVLAAQIAHGYPDGHWALAQLASNAACVRLMSPPERYGDAAAAERLLATALAVARDAGGAGAGATFRNAATFYAVQGYPRHALRLLDEGLRRVDRALADARATAADPAWPGSRDANMRYHAEKARAMRRLVIAVQTHAALLAAWAAEAPPVAGAAAEARLAVLGAECYMELLWW